MTVGASIGIALAPGDGDDPDQLLKNADMALYRAKADGRARSASSSRRWMRACRRGGALELDLREALADRRVRGPLPAAGRISRPARSRGFEALVRWRHPERGMVPPAEFIPVAEETGLIAQIGAVSCAAPAPTPRTGRTTSRSRSTCRRSSSSSGNLLQSVRDALERRRPRAARLELEITEAVLLDKSEPVLATLHALRALGVRISMDDFGTGYSSLSYLRSFPFDKIKIDRSFVRDLGANAGLAGDRARDRQPRREPRHDRSPPRASRPRAISPT